MRSGRFCWERFRCVDFLMCGLLNVRMCGFFYDLAYFSEEVLVSTLIKTPHSKTQNSLTSPANAGRQAQN